MPMDERLKNYEKMFVVKTCGDALQDAIKRYFERKANKSVVAAA